MNQTFLIPYSQDEADQSNAFILHLDRQSRAVHREIHRHTYYELFWLVEGEGKLFNDFNWYTLRGGSIGIIAPGHLHTWEAEWGQFELYFMGFRASASSSLDASFLHNLAIFELSASPVIPVPSNTRQPFDNLFSDVYQHYRNNEVSEEIILNYIRLILLKIDAVYRQSRSIISMTSAQELAQAYHMLVEQHYLERKQVKDYAQILGVTSNHLVRTVREVTGQTPKQIAQNRLLLEAKRLLIHTPEPASTISQLLSFPSSNKFGHWFKHLTQYTPGEFRAQGIDA